MEVVGLDHVYLSVSDIERSEHFYDAVMQALGFRKGDAEVGGQPHCHYFNRSMQISIRPARSVVAHDSYAPGLHHLCLQMRSESEVDEAAVRLAELGVEASAPRLYPEYSADYYATFFEDPDGIRLELVARRRARDQLVEHWDEFKTFLNPWADYGSRQGK